MIKETSPQSGAHLTFTEPTQDLSLSSFPLLSPLPSLISFHPHSLPHSVPSPFFFSFLPPPFSLASSLPPLLSHLFFPSSLPKFLLKNGLKSGAPLLSKAGLISLDFRSSDCLKLEPDTVPVCAQCQQCFGSAESLHIDVFYKSISFSPLHVGKEFKRERTRSWCFLRNPTHLLPLQQQHPPSCP